MISCIYINNDVNILSKTLLIDNVNYTDIIIEEDHLYLLSGKLGALLHMINISKKNNIKINDILICLLSKLKLFSSYFLNIATKMPNEVSIKIDII